jgi:uncharacterized protein
MRFSCIWKEVIIGSAILAAAALSQSPVFAQADPAPVRQVEVADPALWVVSDEDSTVYLFGTVHILRPELDWMTPQVEAAFASADTLYMEADVFSAEAQATMQAMIPQVGLLPQGESLTSKMSDEALADLDVIAGRLGAPSETIRAGIDPLKPWLAGLQLAVAQMQAAGYDPNSGVDKHLAERATEAGKSFGYFETAEEQIGFLSGLPMETQLADLEIGLEQAVENPDQLSDLVSAWAQGDMGRLDALLNTEMRQTSPELYERIIVQRNRNWVPLVEEIVAGEGVAFVAVGSGHMPGENGLIALLRDAGHDVTRQ